MYIYIRLLAKAKAWNKRKEGEVMDEKIERKNVR